MARHDAKKPKSSAELQDELEVLFNQMADFPYDSIERKRLSGEVDALYDKHRDEWNKAAAALTEEMMDWKPFYVALIEQPKPGDTVPLYEHSSTMLTFVTSLSHDGLSKYQVKIGRTKHDTEISLAKVKNSLSMARWI